MYRDVARTALFLCSLSWELPMESTQSAGKALLGIKRVKQCCLCASRVLVREMLQRVGGLMKLQMHAPGPERMILILAWTHSVHVVAHPRRANVFMWRMVICLREHVRRHQCVDLERRL